VNTIEFTDAARGDLTWHLFYLQRFSESAVEQFQDQFSTFLTTVQQFPERFPLAAQFELVRIHRFHPNMHIFYRFNANSKLLTILRLFDPRQHPTS
jgi:plasmid stabilization system protein ParE